MKGLALARQYYDEVGREALEKAVPELLPRLAVGLAGEGSECFGFDDELSQDHDWGPSFCIWLDAEDYAAFGLKIQAIYERLPGAFDGFPARTISLHSGERVGCLCAPTWYRRYTGYAEGPQTLNQWRQVPEAFLATATNGAIFYDPAGHFSAIRNNLQGYYPEDVRIKKIVARAAVMSQAGQYNYSRCLRRGDSVAATLAVAEFTRAALSMAYLLNRQYAPFYKWMHRGLRDLGKLPRLCDQLERLSKLTPGVEAEELIEGICLNTAAELRRQAFSSCTDSFLQAHCEEMMRKIQDPQLRQAHWMEE